jgi:hypothetical protein
MAVLFLALFLLPITASAGTLYRLSAGSDYSEGCTSPCKCAVILYEDLSGTFELSKKSADPLYTIYDLNNIHWLVSSSDGKTVHEISGSGTYKIGGEVALMNQLTLVLNVDGEKISLDSGLIAGGAGFPEMKIPVSTNTECRGTWITIEAKPASIEPDSYQLNDGSSYAEGCVSPCKCLIRSANLAGTFSLKGSANAAKFQQFSVENILWQASFGDGNERTIKGNGLYLQGLKNGKYLQRMTLKLRINGGKTQEFDSGFVPTEAGLPKIAIALDRGTQCYDTIIQLQASPAGSDTGKIQE